MIEFSYLLFFLGEISTLGVVFGLLHLYKQLNQSLRILLIYFLICLTAGFWKLFIVLENKPTLWVLNLFLIAEITLVMLYCWATARVKVARKIFFFLAILLGAFSVVLFKTQQVSEASWINAVAIIGGMFYLFYETLEHPNAERLTRTPDYWFMTGFFLYTTGSFFIFLNSRYVFVKNSEPSLYIEGFRYLLLTGRNVLFTIGVWQVESTPKMRKYLLVGWAVAVVFSIMEYIFSRI